MFLCWEPAPSTIMCFCQSMIMISAYNTGRCLLTECHLGLPLVAWLYTSLYNKGLLKQVWKKKKKWKKNQEKKGERSNQPTNRPSWKFPDRTERIHYLLVSSSLLEANSFYRCQLVHHLSIQTNKNVLSPVVDRIWSFSYFPLACFIWIELLVYLCWLLLICVHSLCVNGLKNTSILCWYPMIFLALLEGKVYTS